MDEMINYRNYVTIILELYCCYDVEMVALC